MIKLTVVAKEMKGGTQTHIESEIDSRGRLLVCEMAHVLKEFYNIEDGQFLVMAFDLFMGGLKNEDNNNVDDHA